MPNPKKTFITSTHSETSVQSKFNPDIFDSPPFEILVSGLSKSGASNLILRFTDNRFLDLVIPDIDGVHPLTKSLQFEGGSIKTTIVDVLTSR